MIPAGDAPDELRGLRVLVTRPADGPGGLAEQLSAAGADVTSLPLTRIERLDPAPLRAALARLARYDWLILTSLNGVAFVMDEVDRLPGVRESLREVNVAVVGSATALALSSRGVEAAVVPAAYNAEALLAALLAHGKLAGKRVLLAVAEGARDVVPTGLSDAGAEVDVVHVYRSMRDEKSLARLRELMSGEAAELVVFTAGSGVNAFADAVGPERCRGLPVASIGPATSMVASSHGMRVVVEAEESTIPGLVQAIIDHYIPADE